MASGFYTGWQHHLLDLPELTKDAFIKLCEDNYYHLSHFRASLEEGKTRMARNQEERIGVLTKAEAEYRAFISKTDTELRQLYQEYQEQVAENNRSSLEIYLDEKNRMETIKKWVEYFPQLSYMWDKLVDPTLYNREMLSYEEWVVQQIKDFENKIKCRKGDIQEYANTVEEEKILVSKFESSKQKFLLEAQ